MKKGLNRISSFHFNILRIRQFKMMASDGFTSKARIRAFNIYFISIFVGAVLCDDFSEMQTERKNRLLLRHPRAVDTKTSVPYSLGTAASLGTGREYMKLRLFDDAVLPSTEFSVQLWIKPEGGQYRYTPIIDVYDACSSSRVVGWTVGIKLPSYSRHNARVVFSLRTDGAASSSSLLAHKGYEPNIWTNVAATYDGTTMRLYMNGAEVSLSVEQSGAVFRDSPRECVNLFVGGRLDEEIYFRGKIDEFGIWSRALSHAEIVRNINKKSSDFLLTDNALVSDAFENFDQWEILSDEDPKLVTSDIVLPYHTVRLEAPPCGRTVCDDPETVLSYLNNIDLRNEKKIRYRVINILDDTGKKPQVYDKQIVEQHRTLNKAFQPYNITLDLQVRRVRNTTLSQKVFMFDCHPYQIGDGHCDQECAHSTTGNDGGDCDHVKSECRKVLLGNGQCNSECNKVYHNYDNGDCCKPGDDRAYRTCVDPGKPQRGYMNIEELKMELQMDSDDVINVYFITSSWNKDTFRGLATYPWEKNVYSTMGGIVMHANIFGKLGKTKALIHEFGHVLGLWHVHRGISEMSCEDPCVETRASMVLGDMCSDTNPTPRNSYCREPSHQDAQNKCGFKIFENTPYKNYMSYADDTCTDHFTPQQEARMHCYIDLIYQPMRDMKQPAPVPVTPKVIQADTDSVHLNWLRPLGLDRGCDLENALHQYAYTATASHSGVRWSPSEATGFPDADHCKPSRYAWKPYHSSTHPGCDFDSCWIELWFKQPVIPSRVSIWVVDIREDTDIYVEVITVEGETIPLGDVPAYCDMETTVLVSTDNKLIDRVKIHTMDSYIAIDAVEVVSQPDFPTCSNKKFPKYKITRDPPFDIQYAITDDNQLIDTAVKYGVTYRYMVQTLLESRASVNSPQLVYTHGQPFCGDGLINGDEECDDRNAVDGDGCSMDCTTEESFLCTGSPSLCSVSPIDTCDDSKQVCGLDPPEGFFDQWAIKANANPEYQGADCPASTVTGKLDRMQKCDSRPVDNFWRPCGEFLDVTGDFWIKVQIYKPVVAVAVIIHLASDGRSVFDQDKKSVHVQLINTDDAITPLTPTSIPISCEENPLLVPVIQDLSQPFHLTKGVRISFTYSSIGMYAVRIRSSPYINPPGISSCTSTELYHPQHGVCISAKCSKKTCNEFPVKYGEAVCSGLENGDSCKIQCDKGYYVDGHENRAECVDGVWITSSPLICSPVDCGRPTINLATVACPDGTIYSKKCHFKCDKPASLIGEDTSFTCQRNGRWSKAKAACVVQCSALNPVAYDKGKLKTTSCIKGPQPVGTQCKVRCQEGYHVQDERTKRRFLRIICDEDGEWFGPKCIPNTCPPLPRMFTGAYTCTNGFQSGSTCTMSCPDDLTVFQTTTCMASGEWNGQLQICPLDKAKICPVPDMKVNIRAECDNSQPGAECTVVCPDGHMPVLKTLQSSTNRNNHFDFSISDGFCDASNNRDVCDWDGGDCCPSTVQGGMVLPMPEDCTAQCECRDPLAIENRRRRRRHKYPYWLL
ncbi:pappalysin-1-like [Mercenaria mercenaria]|uniref:pappalysin-1-like n=1 Tax=Mercenaria mercenaria TaxID=6596 RepID=UPI00234F32B6|nr:pappalysin-1-like [Mercenaria mercenaria]